MIAKSKIGVLALAAAVGMTSLTGCFRKKKYENPIGKDTQQPDKVLFDKAVADIERGRYEVARLTLNTLINTYDTSEFLAKAKLAIADSWMRESGSHGLAQAEAEYKDFILFYPTMEESAEAQEKICTIHLRQMEKPDRDNKHAYRAEEECRQLLVQFPNSKFAPRVQQMLRNIQEVEAEGEMRTARFYFSKGSNPAAANRLQGIVDQYPLFSAADEAMYMLGGAYDKMGARFKPQSVRSYQRLVKDYPLSSFVDPAKKRLKELEADVPEADPVAVARMKYEQENRTKNGVMHNFWGVFKKSPEMSMAAKSGTPAMANSRPTIPVSVPVPAGVPGGINDLGGTVITGASDLDNKPDARQSVQNQANGTAEPKPQAATDKPGETTQQQQPLPTNRQNVKGKKVKTPKAPKSDSK
ncbi:MAG TPA: outer membrane protein assembly factor BamD [Bryobacteraceae bacterium]|nr:outer membrane protein assembly factor BamD [Bryobacteraceae bacterium]